MGRRKWHPRVRVGGKPVIFDPDPEYALETRLEALAKKLQQAPPKKRAYRKWVQEEILCRVRRHYPDGDIPHDAEVRRAISDKKFHPAHNTVHAALHHLRLKK